MTNITFPKVNKPQQSPAHIGRLSHVDASDRVQSDGNIDYDVLERWFDKRYPRLLTSDLIEQLKDRVREHPDDARARHWLGRVQLWKAESPQQWHNAIRLLEGAAAAGILEAGADVALALIEAGADQGYPNAVRDYAFAAEEEGSPRGIYAAAYVRLHGIGVQRDTDGALARLRLAAALGLSHARLALARAYIWPEVHPGLVAPDPCRGMGYMIDLAEDGFPTAQAIRYSFDMKEFLPNICRPRRSNQAEILADLKAAVDAHVPDAAVVLARAHREERHGLENDPAKWVPLLERDADLGSKHAMFELAVAHFARHAPEPDDAEGWRLLEKAVRAGHREAQLLLAVLTSSDLVGQRDLRMAEGVLSDLRRAKVDSFVVDGLLPMVRYERLRARKFGDGDNGMD